MTFGMSVTLGWLLFALALLALGWLVVRHNR
jgi:small-conductance mechanosensitive channel